MGSAVATELGGVRERDAAGDPLARSLHGRKIGFLFNHDAPHQIAHSAPIAYELSRLHPECAISILTTSSEQARVAASIAARFPGHRCASVDLGARGAVARASSLLGRSVPAQRVALLRDHAPFLATHDALVVPEKTSLLLRSHFGCAAPKLIHTRHGAGDREVGFDAHSREFDLVLLAGEKIRRRLASAGALPERFAIVGYPKLDAVGGISAPRPRLFANDRPTVLYNPHFSPNLSSWFAMGREILELFRRSQRYNLIFAPHVMLFRRRLQISQGGGGIARTGSLPRELLTCEHVHVDLGSEASTDMTYTRAADLYLGDVSSQVCEFLLQPRPCVFANPRGIAWRNDPSFEAWKLGPVIQTTAQLEASLDAAFGTHAEFLAAQQAYLRDTFDLQPGSSARRAAAAIASFLAEPAADRLSA